MKARRYIEILTWKGQNVKKRLEITDNTEQEVEKLTKLMERKIDEEVSFVRTKFYQKEQEEIL